MNEDELAVVYGLGICYLAKGDKEKAISYLEKVELRNPKFGKVQEILANLEKEKQS